MLYTTPGVSKLRTRGPNAVREAISSDPQSHFVSNEKIIYRKYKNLVEFVECNVTYPETTTLLKLSPLELLCNSLCGPRRKKCRGPAPQRKTLGYHLTGGANTTLIGEQK